LRHWSDSLETKPTVTTLLAATMTTASGTELACLLACLHHSLSGHDHCRVYSIRNAESILARMHHTTAVFDGWPPPPAHQSHLSSQIFSVSPRHTVRVVSKSFLI
jgi:hypothetical protein